MIACGIGEKDALDALATAGAAFGFGIREAGEAIEALSLELAKLRSAQRKKKEEARAFERLMRRLMNPRRGERFVRYRGCDKRAVIDRNRRVSSFRTIRLMPGRARNYVRDDRPP